MSERVGYAACGIAGKVTLLHPDTHYDCWSCQRSCSPNNVPGKIGGGRKVHKIWKHAAPDQRAGEVES